MCIYIYMYKYTCICIYVYQYKYAFGTSFSFCHTVSNAVMPIGTASFMPFLFPSPSLLTFMDHMLLGLCPHLLLCIIYITHILKQFLVEAMDIKQPESQELPEASPPRPPQATSTTSPTTSETLTPEEFELIKQHRATTREFSPAKKPRTDQGWEEFVTPLSAKDVELSELDFGLQQELWSSPQARAGFPCPQPHLSRSTSLRPRKASSRRLTSPRSDLSLTFKRSKLQHLSILEQYNTHIEDIGIHGWQQGTPTSWTTSYRYIQDLQWTTWNILLHEDKGPE